MALEFNSENKKKVPITRNNKFFGPEDFDLQMAFATEYLEQQANQTVILYQVDLEKTKVNDVYKEAKKNAVRYKHPVEIPVIYEIADAEMKTYDSTLQKGIYAQTLEEYGCDISRGDYIGVQITSQHREYFVVTDDGRVGATSNKYTLYGTKPYARKIECASVDESEFNG